MVNCPMHYEVEEAEEEEGDYLTTSSRLQIHKTLQDDECLHFCHNYVYAGTDSQKEEDPRH
jgi:hypothetical protein